MELEIYFFPQIIEAFSTENQKEFERRVKSRLKSYFEVRENRVLLSEKKIFLLNEILGNLKKIWIKGIPLPFSLAPRGKKVPFRPGKVYLSPKEANEIKKIYPDVILLPWGEVFELFLSESYQPDGLFTFRDFLLLGPFKPCLLCGLRWHEPHKCPNLKEKEAFSFLQEFLKKKPAELLKNYTQKFEQMAFKEALTSMSRRVFYFKPAFFEILFTSNAKTWENIPLKKGLSRGGNLFLGLEAIRDGNLAKAREYFEKLDLNRDWQANLGLLLSKALEEDLEEALYYAEKALHLAETPLAQAYLFLWKGWLFERQRKFFEAEEAYQEALKRDRAFWPARFHLAGSQIKYASQRARNTLTPLLKEPLAVPLVLFEGRFLPFATEIEDEIQSFFEQKQEEAVVKLVQAENSLRPLLKALPEEEVERFEQSLANLRKEIYQGGFLDIITAEKRAFDLALELQGYLFRQTQKLRGKFKDYQKQLERFEEFWRNYPYRDPDDPFQQKLLLFREELAKLARLLKQDPQKGLKPAFKATKKIEELSLELKKEEKRLRKEWLFKKQLSSFIKTFLILETFLFLIFLLVPALYHLIGDQKPPSFFRLSVFVGFSIFFLVISLLRSLQKKIEV